CSNRSSVDAYRSQACLGNDHIDEVHINGLVAGAVEYSAFHSVFYLPQVANFGITVWLWCCTGTLIGGDSILCHQDRLVGFNIIAGSTDKFIIEIIDQPR